MVDQDKVRKGKCLRCPSCSSKKTKDERVKGMIKARESDKESLFCIECLSSFSYSKGKDGYCSDSCRDTGRKREKPVAEIASRFLRKPLV